MTRFRLFWIALWLLWASFALGQEVRFNFDNTADFAKFKTYKWVALESVAPIDKLTDDQIKTALDAALARKGLSKVTYAKGVAPPENDENFMS